MEGTRQSLTLAELADATQCQLVGDPLHRVSGVADLASASPCDASYFSEERYAKDLAGTHAGVIVVPPETPRAPGRNYLIAARPNQVFVQITQLITALNARGSGFTGIHPSAVIHPSVVLGKDVTIGPLVVIDQGAKVGDRTTISAGCAIGVDVTIGTDCLLHPHVTILARCVVGNRVILQPGVVLGSCGFGYRPDDKGHHLKLEHIGNVVVEDDVEIGANTTVDRARFKSTRIGRGTKIDNQVQIAHNVQIGEDNLIVGQSGIAGSSTTGRHVVLAGRVAVNDHVQLADGVIVAAFSGVSKSLTKAGKYSGIPVAPASDHNRNAVLLRNIDKHVARLDKLEQMLHDLKKS